MPAPAPTWTPPVGAVTRLVLVRHGSTVHSLARRFSGRNDLPLDEAGHAQAAALGQRSFGAIDAIVGSPIRRARETAQAIAVGLGLPVIEHADLAELDFGAFEGLSGAEVRERFPAEFAAWMGAPEAAPPGGESFADLDRRVLRARNALIAAYPDSTVVVVTHVSPIKMLVRAALDAPMSSIYRMFLDTASVSQIDYAPDGTGSLRLFNDTSHLARLSPPVPLSR